MKKVRLNMKLIGTLNSVLFIPVAELCKATGIAKSTWYDVKDNPDAITIQYLIAVANGLHIPVRRFFSDDRADVIGKRDDYVTEPYIPCEYNGAVLRELISSRPDATWKEAAEVTGMGYQQLQKSLMTETRLPVPRLLAVCEAFDIDPFTVLVDPNPSQKQKDKKEGSSALLAKIASMHEEITAIRRQASDMAEKFLNLTDKYESLLEAHRTLLWRFDKFVEDRHVGMAAEEEKEREQKKK